MPQMVTLIKQRNTGSTIPLINLSVLKSLPIPVPPLTEQHAIASILSSLDAKIELNNQMNKTLEAIGQALFKKWFVDERKDEWKKGKLGDYADIIKGVSYRSTELKESNKALVTLKSMNRGGGLNKNGFKFVEFPSVFVNRAEGESNATISEFKNSLLSLFAIKKQFSKLS